MTGSNCFDFTVRLGHGVDVREADLAVYNVSRGTSRLDHSVVVTDSNFTLNVPTTGDHFFYAVLTLRKIAIDGAEVDLGPRMVQLLSAFSRDSDNVVLSESLTVATVYAFARFIQIDSERKVGIAGPDRALDIALGMRNNFVATDGIVSNVITTSPNGLETNSYPLFNFLSNLLYYGMVDPGVYAGFLELTAAPSLLQALITLAHDPFTEVDAVYALIGEKEQPYSPSLPSLTLPEGASPVPTQWTLTVKVNDSGAENFLIGGPANVAFDKLDRAWITNNVRQGTPDSATFCVILEPDGSPAPFSPLFGGGLLGCGFGVTADSSGEKIYFGNFGWGSGQWNPQTGSVSVFSYKGEALSPPNGYTSQLSRVQGLAFDSQGNLWITSWGTKSPLAPGGSSPYDYGDEPNSAVVVYLQGNPERALVYPFANANFAPFDVAIDRADNVFVSNGGDSDNGVKSSVYKLRLENGAIHEIAQWESNYQDPKDASKNGYESFKQIILNAQGELFVAGVTSNRLVKLDSDLNYLGELTTNTNEPWGICRDGDGVLFVANFAQAMAFDPTDPKQVVGPFGVAVIHNEDDSTSRLMTLPTGGDSVTLANGLPLYGNAANQRGSVPPPCYAPLMRATATSIDRAGNLWVFNNWKPSIATDIAVGNPGGDGVVIFVGVAEPPRRTVHN